MIEVYKNLWIGDSEDEKWIVRHRPPIDCVLVTAHDMVPTNDWKDKIEYMHVGIVDGPGNTLAIYHAAVLALSALARRREGCKVLVCDHSGGRSLAVAVMYLYLLGEGPSWDEAIDRVRATGKKVPAVHDVHREAFFEMDWSMITRVLSAEV